MNEKTRPPWFHGDESVRIDYSVASGLKMIVIFSDPLWTLTFNPNDTGGPFTISCVSEQQEEIILPLIHEELELVFSECRSDSPENHLELAVTYGADVLLDGLCIRKGRYLCFPGPKFNEDWDKTKTFALFLSDEILSKVKGWFKIS